MEANNSWKSPQDSPKRFPQLFDSPANSVAVYTVLSVLKRMKTELGFEAMLEFHEKYLETIDLNNPALKTAVEKALHIVNVEKIYKDAMKG